MTTYSYSNLSRFEMCPAFWGATYGVPKDERPEQKTLDVGLIGSRAHVILEDLFPWLEQVEDPSDKAVLTWLSEQVHDWTEEDGIAESPVDQEAIWMIEAGKPGVLDTFRGWTRAGERGLEAKWTSQYEPDCTGGWFPCELGAWPRWGTTGFIAIADVWWISGETLHLVDWKTGARFPKWLQLELYAWAGALRFPGVTAINASFCWLKEGGVMDTRRYSREEALGKAWTLDQRIAEIEEATEFETNPSRFACSICPKTKKECKERK